MRLIFLAASLLLLSPTPEHDLSGRWALDVYLNPGGEPFETQLELQQAEEKLTGTWIPGVEELKTPVQGTLQDNSVDLIAHPTHPRYKGREFHFRGTITSARAMSGQLEMGEDLEVRWDARREEDGQSRE